MQNLVLTKYDEKGLSLIELMIVVAIIGILAALAIPRFQSFQARARQAEVKGNLSQIYTLELSFHGDNDRYGSTNLGAIGYYVEDSTNSDPITNCNLSNEIGFHLTDCRKVRYTYEFSGNTTAFRAVGHTGGGGRPGVNLVFPGCEFPDDWAIDQNKTIENNIVQDDGHEFAKAIEGCL